MSNLFREKSVEGCKHVLMSVHCNDIYNTSRDEMIEFYGNEIFAKAEEELYSSRAFAIIFGDEKVEEVKAYV